MWSIYRIKQAILKLTNLSCCRRNTHGLNSFLLSRNFMSQCFESNSYSLKKHHIFKFQCLLFHCTTACCWICKNDFCKKGFIKNLFYVLTVQQQQRISITMKLFVEMQFTLVIIYTRVCLVLIAMLAENILFFNFHKMCSTSTLLGVLLQKLRK